MRNDNIITRQNIERVLNFLPYFKDSSSKFYTIDKVKIMDPYIYDVRVHDFIRTIYKENFIIIFDHPRWQNEALKYIEDPKLLESASLLILPKLLTLHIRKERFCSGHLAAAIDTGHMVKILMRLKELKSSLEDKKYFK